MSNYQKSEERRNPTTIINNNYIQSERYTTDSVCAGQNAQIGQANFKNQDLRNSGMSKTSSTKSEENTQMKLDSDKKTSSIEKTSIDSGLENKYSKIEKSVTLFYTSFKNDLKDLTRTEKSEKEKLESKILQLTDCIEKMKKEKADVDEIKKRNKFLEKRYFDVHCDLKVANEKLQKVLEENSSLKEAGEKKNSRIHSLVRKKESDKKLVMHLEKQLNNKMLKICEQENKTNSLLRSYKKLKTKVVNLEEETNTQVNDKSTQTSNSYEESKEMLPTIIPTENSSCIHVTSTQQVQTDVSEGTKQAEGPDIASTSKVSDLNDDASKPAERLKRMSDSWREKFNFNLKTSFYNK